MLRLSLWTGVICEISKTKCFMLSDLNCGLGAVLVYPPALVNALTEVTYGTTGLFCLTVQGVGHHGRDVKAGG